MERTAAEDTTQEVPELLSPHNGNIKLASDSNPRNASCQSGRAAWLSLIVVTTFLKILLFPAYHSTDFDVHRNWLALTHKLPLRKWYYEATSQWTLDYPPFFAYFEYFLSQLVPKSVFDDGCLDIVAKGKYGWPTIAFQRTTVVLSELALGYSLQKMMASRISMTDQQKFAVACVIWLNPGWMILDHIHFQYNGAMFGLLVASLVAAADKRRVLCGALFATLLCLKHIYLYVAPAYFVYLLRSYILEEGRLNILNGVKLGSVVVGIFGCAFFPFRNDMHQLLLRLFPFSRGLTHAYWAPNFWALYQFADRVLGAVFRRSVAGSTRGIVGNVAFSVLPEVSSRTCFVLTLFYQVLALVPVAIRPTFTNFLSSVTLCAFAAFLFGWHVHEKAVMLIIVPFAILSVHDRRLWNSFVPLLTSGAVSLFPLIYSPGESIFKYTYTTLYLVVVMITLPYWIPLSRDTKRFFLEKLTVKYNLGFVLLLPLISSLKMALPRYEFAGLMLLSVYCSIGIIGSWLALNWLFFKRQQRFIG